MNNLWLKLMLGGSTVALFSAASTGAVLAQGGGGGDIEQVVVSASRINIQGYTQPTPVTVIGAAKLEEDAFTDIGVLSARCPRWVPAWPPTMAAMRAWPRKAPPACPNSIFASLAPPEP